MADAVVRTERLILRGWEAGDASAMLAICRDPRVMEFLGPPMEPAQMTEVIARQQAHQARLGHCFWVIERFEDAEILGFCGLQPGPEGTPLAGCIEIGWRLGAAHWGQGYAREAAAASLDWGFAHLDVDAIWAITVLANRRSWGLMERLGMKRHPELDFDHPNVPDGSPLKRHLTYSRACPGRD